jgi:hypothetical protein
MKSSNLFTNQKGQVAAIFLAIFAFLLIFFMVPRNFVRSTPNGSPAPSGQPYCQDIINDPNAPTVTAPAYTTSSIELGTTRQYRLIKKSVLLNYGLYGNRQGHHFFEEFEEKYTDNAGKKFLKRIPNGLQGRSYKLPSSISGEFELVFADYGLLYLFYADDQFNLLKTGTLDVDGTAVIDLATADIYKAVDLPELPDWVINCVDAGTNGATKGVVFKGNEVVWPKQQKSDSNEQLQLEWFVFDSKTVLLNAWWTPHCKPAVYLYPPEKMQVNVKVHPAGTLIYTDPQYDSKKGWTVDAYPDGKIYDSRFTMYDKPFNYLYFESKVPDQIIKKPTKGWVIQSSAISHQPSAESNWFRPLEEKFNVILPQLGLNAVQTKDFIEYWKKALPYSPYYFIGVIDQSNVDQIERLEITPKPDSINRVRIYFERLDQPKVVEAPQLGISDKSLESRKISPDNLTLATSHFSVVEWGGMVKNDPNHPFTCSQ